MVHFSDLALCRREHAVGGRGSVCVRGRDREGGGYNQLEHAVGGRGLCVMGG